MQDVVGATVYLTDMRYFEAMDGVWAEVFAPVPPARTVVLSLLAEPEMLVEIEATARLP